jgi:hypothetical protein
LVLALVRQAQDDRRARAEFLGIEALRRVREETTINLMRCPCCGRPLEPAKNDDARPGDLWCEPCGWLLLKEVLAMDVEPARCPTHEPYLEPGPPG